MMALKQLEIRIILAIQTSVKYIAHRLKQQFISIIILNKEDFLIHFCNQLLLLQMRISLQYRVGNEVCNGIYFSCESICSWAS